MRSVRVAVLAALCASLVAASSAGGTSGRFVASGPPGSGACAYGDDSEPTGTQSVRAGATGRLVVKAGPFRGDWDLAVRDAAGNLIARHVAWDPATLGGRHARLDLPVSQDQQLEILACNWESPQTSLEVRWRILRERGPASGLGGLLPGALPDLVEIVPITVVLVGYDRTEVDADALVATLPATTEPVVRAAGWYGTHRALGITYKHRYQVVRATRAYEDQVFAQLRRLAVPAPLTPYQELYNGQAARSRTLTDNHEIDAVAFERWLAGHPPDGVDTTRPTVFLLDGSDRADFRPHVYVHRGDPDPDTGQLIGTWPTASTIAWGGTTADDPQTPLGSTRRIWFHDLSAGPDWRTGNWNVDDPDLDGDGVVDRRLPPAWDYGDGKVAPLRALTTDLAAVIRYVAVDMFFAPSPLYPPSLTPPRLPEAVTVDIEAQDVTVPTGAHRTHLDTGRLQRLIAPVVPKVGVRAKRAEMDAQHRRCHAGVHEPTFYAPGCSAEHPYPAMADLFVYHAQRRGPWREGRPYRIESFTYTVHEPTGSYGLCFGYADDDWVSGVQSFVFAQLTTGCLYWFGYTRLLAHEVGHHVGLPHPHDGYDSTTGVEFGPWGEHYFAWVGDEVSSVMSYLHNENDFSQFDRDAMARWTTAAYLEAANAAAARLLAARPDARDHLGRAGQEAAHAIAAFGRSDHVEAQARARAAHALVLQVADDLGVTVRGSDAGWRLRREPLTRQATRPHGWAATDRFGDSGLGAPILDVPGQEGPRLDRPRVSTGTVRLAGRGAPDIE